MRRSLKILLALSIICSAIISPSVKVSAESSGEMLNALVAVGVVEQSYADDIQYLNIIKRGEFAYLILGLLGDYAAGDNAVNKFIDVASDYKYASAINSMYSMGYISGVSASMFMPEEYITFEQATAITVKLAGYDVTAKLRGGYPLGYIQIANEIGLLKGINGKIGDGMYIADVIRLMYNALDVECHESYSFDSDTTVRYKTGEKLLKKYHNMKKMKGMVTDNSITALDGLTQIGKRKVVIDHITYEIGASRADELLGFNVIFIATDDDKEPIQKIKFAAIDDNRNIIIKVKGENIDSVSERLDRVVYHDNIQENIRLNISPIVKVIYNGLAATDVTPEILSPDIGEVMFIDNDNDGTYDVVIADSYYVMIVDSVSYTNMRIFDKKGTSISWDEDNCIYYVTRNGTPADIYDISKYDVLFVKEASNTKNRFLDIQVNSETFTGKLESKNFLDNVFVIGGMEYEVSPSFYEYENVFVKTKIGESYNFLLDPYGKIAAAMNNDTNDYKYGYLNKISSEALSGVVQIRVFEESGAFAVYKLRENLLFNDEGRSAAYVMGKLMKKTGEPVYQLLKYTVNENNEISKLHTFVDEGDINTFNRYTFADITYKSRNNTFWSQCYPADKAKAFVIYSADMTNDNSYEIYDASTYFSNDTKYTIEAYDMDDWSVARAIVTYKTTTGSSVNVKGYMFLVTNIMSAVTEDGIITKRLVGSTRSFINQSLIINPESYDKFKSGFDSLEAGQIIYIEKNSAGEITNYSPFMNINTRDTSKNQLPPDTWAEYIYLIADAVEIDTARGMIKAKSGSVTRSYRLRTSSIPVLRYNVNRKSVSMIALDDIARDDYIIMRFWDTVATECIIVDYEED